MPISLFKKIFILLFILFPTLLNAQTISINAVGDIMMGTDFPRNRLPKDGGAHLLKRVAPILNDADITFGNLEGTLINGGTPHKKCKDTTACYLFRTPKSYAKHLKSAGFDVMSLANNHAHDFGEEGRDSTMSALSENGIKFTGRKGTVARFRIDSISVAFIGFAPSPGCYDLLDLNSAAKEISALADSFNIVVVSMHAGAEGPAAAHVPDSMEIYYEEERGNVIEFAKNAIDAGADLVIGHGPHVPRAIDIYKERLIAYSLGNFCTYKGFNISGIRGYAPILNVELDRNGALIKGKIISAKQIRPGGTVPGKKAHAFKLIRKLTKQDFPNSKLLFENDGSFRSE